jgi:hypothetical protein
MALRFCAKIMFIKSWNRNPFSYCDSDTFDFYGFARGAGHLIMKFDNIVNFSLKKSDLHLRSQMPFILAKEL